FGQAGILPAPRTRNPAEWEKSGRRPLREDLGKGTMGRKRKEAERTALRYRRETRGRSKHENPGRKRQKLVFLAVFGLSLSLRLRGEPSPRRHVLSDDHGRPPGGGAGG